jgi:hypothetical protein
LQEIFTAVANEVDDVAADLSDYERGRATFAVISCIAPECDAYSVFPSRNGARIFLADKNHH